MTSTNKKRLLILALAIFVIGAIILFTLFDGEDEVSEVIVEVPTATETDLGVSEDIDIPTATSGLEIIPEEIIVIEGRTASLQIAELFSERYGSYSNQGDYQNLKDLLSVMTDSHRASTEKFLSSVEGMAPADSYEGYTATKISSEEIFYNESSGSAQYEIVLQQLKDADNSESTIEYPKLRVSLQRINDEWLVGKTEWVR